MSGQLEYWKRNYCVGKFGVKYLDDELEGIAKRDLILIGARSGASKISLANLIFEKNKKDGRKVALFSLENFNGDLYSHDVMIEYKNITHHYGITPRQWQMNLFKIDYEALEKAEAIVEKKYKDALIFGRQMNYGKDELARDLKKVSASGVELIILDHIDYVDKDNPNESDVSFMTSLMKTIRCLQEQYGVAIVALSHLRKPGFKNDVIIPNENEFIGSSNKAKESTVVIMFAPDDEGNINLLDDTLKQTWCCIRKLRNGGISNKCAKLYYDKNIDRYIYQYELYAVNYSGTKLERLGK